MQAQDISEAEANDVNGPANYVPDSGRSTLLLRQSCMLPAQRSQREMNSDSCLPTTLRFPFLWTPLSIQRCCVGPWRRLATGPPSHLVPKPPHSGIVGSDIGLLRLFATGGELYSCIRCAGFIRCRILNFMHDFWDASVDSEVRCNAKKSSSCCCC